MRLTAFFSFFLDWNAFNCGWLAKVKMLHNILRQNAVNCVLKRRLTAVGPFSRNKSHIFDRFWKRLCLGPYQIIAARRGMAKKNPLTSIMKRSYWLKFRLYYLHSWSKSHRNNERVILHDFYGFIFEQTYYWEICLFQTKRFLNSLRWNHLFIYFFFLQGFKRSQAFYVW